MYLLLRYIKGLLNFQALSPLSNLSLTFLIYVKGRNALSDPLKFEIGRWNFHRGSIHYQRLSCSVAYLFVFYACVFYSDISHCVIFHNTSRSKIKLCCKLSPFFFQLSHVCCALNHLSFRMTPSLHNIAKKIFIS